MVRPIVFNGGGSMTTQNKTGNVGNYDREQVQNIERQLATVNDPDTALEIGRSWMRESAAKGVTREQVSSLIDQQFGGATTSGR
jgi:hypothetical protein